MNNTPTPWINDGRKLIASTTPPKWGLQAVALFVSSEDAAFAVRAANAHDGLILRLKDALACLEKDSVGEVKRIVISGIKQVIAEAEGK